MQAIPTDIPFVVVLNAGSGAGDADEARAAIAGVLSEAGRAFEIRQVAPPLTLDAAVQQATALASARNGVIVAAGGDGTLNAVAQAAMRERLRFGVIPRGTFNYFGRAYGYPSDAAEATRALLDAQEDAVQVGLVNDRVFLVNASLGLYPRLLEDREEQKQRFGRSRIVAAWAALVTIFSGFRPLRVELELGGRRTELRALTLFVGNNPLQLEQVGLADASALQHGCLVAVLVRPMSAPALLWTALRGAIGRLDQSIGVDSFPLVDLTVHPPRRRAGSLKVATDGESVWMPTPVRFRVSPEPLRLLRPRPSEVAAP